MCVCVQRVQYSVSMQCVCTDVTVKCQHAVCVYRRYCIVSPCSMCVQMVQYGMCQHAVCECTDSTVGYASACSVCTDSIVWYVSACSV
jgi:hypothetical protein